MKLHSLRARMLLIAPVRLALGAAWLIVARAAGSGATPALLAFVVGAFGITFLAFTDPRARFARADVEPLPAPPGVVLAPWWQQALAAALPSTVGVSVLAAIAVFPSPTLAALLGGVSAGLGIAGLISLPGVDPALLVDPRSHVVYRK
jgi:hypothetical protein